MNPSEKIQGAEEGLEPANLTFGNPPVAESIAALGSRMLSALLLVAVAAGLIAWTLAERFRVVEVVQLKVGQFAGADLSVPRATRNGAIVYATLGALLGLGLGSTSGLLIGRRSVTRIVLVGLTGVVLGAFGGAASSYALFPIYFRNMEKADLMVSLLIHLGIWAAVGAVAGLSFGIGSGHRDVIARSLAGGITGAAVGALLFDLAGAFLPLAHTERPLSEEVGTRLAANMLLSVCVAVGVVVVASQKPRDAANKA